TCIRFEVLTRRFCRATRPAGATTTDMLTPSDGSARCADWPPQARYTCVTEARASERRGADDLAAAPGRVEPLTSRGHLCGAASPWNAGPRRPYCRAPQAIRGVTPQLSLPPRGRVGDDRPGVTWTSSRCPGSSPRDPLDIRTGGVHRAGAVHSCRSNG